MTEISSAYDYYKTGRPDLMTELTVCESFSSENSPYAKAFGLKKSYGALLGDFILKHNILKSESVIAEAGGGYGSLMKGLLQEYNHLVRRVVMFDLSESLLHRQRNTLNEWKGKIDFIQTDIQKMISSVAGIQLFIFNEIIGDLDAVNNVDPENLEDEPGFFINKYNLDIPDKEHFTINIGAIKLVENICRNNYSAFISEHSSDPLFPNGMEYLNRGLCQAFPREIKLHNHFEYSIRFSHLIKVAKAWNREIRTGPLIDILGIKNAEAMRFVFANHISRTEKHEIIYEMLDHVREYRWILII